MWCEPRKKHVTGLETACRKFVEATIGDRLRCYYCSKKYKKIDEHTFKPDCDCLKEEIRVSVGGYDFRWR